MAQHRQESLLCAGNGFRVTLRQFELAWTESRNQEETTMPLLENHIAVVTGAGSGIGRAIAAGYAREGAQVALLDINAAAAEAAAQEIREAGGQAASFALDVTKRGDCIAVAKRVAAQIGPVSILVNNAGINRRNAFTSEAAALFKDWDDIIAINLNGTFHVTHAFLHPLRA